MRLSLAGNLGVVGFFKYFKHFNFFVDTACPLLEALALGSNAFVPVGISCYTFQTLSYTIDIYRKAVVCGPRPDRVVGIPHARGLGNRCFAEELR